MEMLLIYYNLDYDDYIIYFGNDYNRYEVDSINKFNCVLIGILVYDVLDKCFVSVRSSSSYLFFLDYRLSNSTSQ